MPRQTPSPFPPGKFIPRRRLLLGDRPFYGWSPNCTGWTYSPPYWPTGPEPGGWASFVVAQIFALPKGMFWRLGYPEGPPSFLAIDFGCYWRGGDRCWAPSYMVHDTLEQAQDWIEARLLAGILDGMPQ